MSVDRPGNRLACPRCLTPDFLGENVQGWREIENVRMIGGNVVVSRRSFAEVHDAERVSFFCSGPKCNVDEELRDRDLVQLDAAGQVVADQPQEQGRLV